MEMEYVITAKSDAAIKTVHVIPGDMVEGGDLFIELS
jgi:pyruvate carboxylase